MHDHAAAELHEVTALSRRPAPSTETAHSPARQDVLRLQRSAGNRAVAGHLQGVRPGAPVAVQRHAPGTELPRKAQQVGEITGGAAPSATRTAQEATAQKGEGEKAGKEFETAQTLSPGAMSLSSAQKVLQGTFGAVKTIVPGTVVVLAGPAACSAKYDEVCIAAGLVYKDGVPWKAGDRARLDAEQGVQVEGFAWKGVVYVNGATTLVTATAHEVLHNNTGDGFRTQMGETFNEGVTELLARQALDASEVTVPAVTAYPVQVSLATRLKELLGVQTLTDAYFNGPAALVKAYEALKGAGTWATLRALAEKLDVDGAMKAMSKSLTSWWRRK